MKGFKFYKTKKNKFRWEDDSVRLEFSNPSIQSHNEYLKIKNTEDIMYYYYDVKIFKKRDGKCELVCKRHTYDFPCILELQWILNYQLNNKVTKEDGQKIEYSNGEIRYKRTLETEGFACDDFYEITRIDSESEDDDNCFRYVVYCGTTYDFNGDLNSLGIRTPYVKESDIKELLKCVNEFIQYSIDENNKEVEIFKQSFEIIGNKLYEYVYDYKNNKIDKTKISQIVTEDEKISLIIVSEEKQYEYDNCTIIKICDNSINIKDRCGDNKNIKLDEIRYFNSESTYDKLDYNVDEIVNDFINILNDNEKKEFKINNTDMLLNKWESAIINRTAMCRDEHKFNIDYHTGDNVKAVEPIVIEVINKIKEILNKEC